MVPRYTLDCVLMSDKGVIARMGVGYDTIDVAGALRPGSSDKEGYWRAMLDGRYLVGDVSWPMCWIWRPACSTPPATVGRLLRRPR